MFKREEYALVLDFLTQGKAEEARREPTAQVIGETYFTLLELITKPDAKLDRMEKVYIGKGVRDKIERIKCRVKYNELTSSAQREVEPAIKAVIAGRQQDFVNFFNKAGPINIRLHSLELLPNIGKKNLEALIAEREKTPFQSLQDVKERVTHLANVEEILVHRIVSELKGDEKYYLFVKIPPKEEEEGGYGRGEGYRRGDGYGRGGGEGYRRDEGRRPRY